MSTKLRFVIMASIAIGIAIDAQAQQIIDSYQGLGQAIVRHLDAALVQWLRETVTDIQVTDFTGGPGAGGGKTPIGTRSPGGLRNDLTSGSIEDLAGWLGTTEATASYAHVILGEGTTTIRPTNAEHLWIPIADNLNASGNARLSPRAAMSLRTSTGKRALRIFRSKRGNLVAFLPGEVTSTGEFRAKRGTVTRGPKKGQQRGQLLFVLKDEVTVEGADVFVRGVERNRARGEVLLTAGIQAAFDEVTGG